jgi:hypothetical protein
VTWQRFASLPPIANHFSPPELLPPFFLQRSSSGVVVAVGLGFFLLPLPKLLFPLVLGWPSRIFYLVIEILFLGLERVLFGRPLGIKVTKRLLLSLFSLRVGGGFW